MAGLPMPRQSDAEAAEDKKRASLIEVLALAARMFEANLQQPIGAKARGYLSDRGLGPPVQQRFSLGYASPERFASPRRARGQGRRRRADDRGGPPHPWRGHRRPLRPVPRPGDVPDPRPLRPGHRLRRAGDGAGSQGEIPQFAGDRRFSTKVRCCSITIARAKAPTRAAKSSSSRAISTRSRSARPAFPMWSRRSAPRSPPTSVRCLWANGERADPVLRRRQRRPAGGLPRHRDGAAADRGRKEPAVRACCPRVRIRTTSSV